LKLGLDLACPKKLETNLHERQQQTKSSSSRPMLSMHMALCQLCSWHACMPHSLARQPCHQHSPLAGATNIVAMSAGKGVALQSRLNTAAGLYRFCALSHQCKQCKVLWCHGTQKHSGAGIICALPGCHWSCDAKQALAQGLPGNHLELPAK
jgi:hypothetical protein